MDQGLRVVLVARLGELERWFYGAAFLLAACALAHCANGGNLWWAGLLLLSWAAAASGIGWALGSLSRMRLITAGVA